LELLPILGIILTIIGIISAISVRLYLSNRAKNTVSDIDKGVMDTEIEHFKEELSNFKKDIEVIEEEIQKNHLDYDSIQLQIADLRERLARIEGPKH